MWRRKHYTFRLGFSFRGSVIDIETTGLNDDFVVATGILTFKRGIAKIDVYFLEEPQAHDRYLRFINSIIDFLPKPRFAYNASFEARFLKRRDLVDIMYRTTGILWDPDLGDYYEGVKWARMVFAANSFLDKEEDRTIKQRMKEALKVLNDKISGATVPILYKKFMFTRKQEYADEIIRHAASDVILEAYLVHKAIKLLEEALREIRKKNYYWSPYSLIKTIFTHDLVW